MVTTQFPVPEQNESLERYTIRCSQVLPDMDPDQFNRAVWDTWRKYRGPTDEEKIAGQYFSPEKYRVVPSVCVFAEHQTTTAKGEPRNYDLDYLSRIVAGNNDRIADVGAFPALAEDHTSNPGDPNPRDPQILGYAGNYRLGRIGRKEPRWAVFQDEYQLKDSATVLDRKPRRSVELWTFKDGRAHFDPIAALGAEAPRIALPMRYQQFEHGDASVERYSYAGNDTVPAAGNTFVQSVGNKKDKYSADDPSLIERNRRRPAGMKGAHEGQGINPRELPPIKYLDDDADATPVTTDPDDLVRKPQIYQADDEAPSTPEGESDMPRLAPEDLQQIIEAFSQTDAFQFLNNLLDESQRAGIDLNTLTQGLIQMASGPPPGAEPMGGEGPPIDELLSEEPEPDLTAPAPPGSEPAPAPSPEEAGAEPAINPETQPVPEERRRMFSQPNDPSAEPSTPDTAQPAAGPPVTTPDPATPEKYTLDQAQAEVEKYRAAQETMLKDLATQQGQIQQLLRVNTNHARQSRLTEIADRFGGGEGFVNLQEECDRCLFSENANMSDDEFNRHAADLEKFGQRFLDAQVYVPGGEAPMNEEATTPEKFAQSQQVNTLAVKIATEARNRGETINYDEAKTKAIEKLAASAA